MSDTTPHSAPARTDITERIAEAIFSGHYQPESLLPREVDLCEQYGVSRSTMRNTLHTFVAKGILKRISGKGTRVQEMSEWHLLDPRVMRWMAAHGSDNQRFEREMYAFRVAVEPFVTSMAAQLATASDLVAIEAAFDGMIAASQQADLMWQGRSHNDYDVSFHEAIFAASHNMIWTQLSHLLRPSITLLVEKSNHSADELQDSMERHRKVMEAIRLRQPEAAYTAALGVLERTGRDLGVEEQPGDLPLLPPLGAAL
ncbi:FCD domain-containing protein [Aestuariirhabdus sp. Z084]|uniref:FadR/GntR family transcriptional regulator n=1 Tax=Aestuariirhabdus haliotis TaxID=2918751 RepID=UPI00201B457F|nr:FCD domain-containing protein [Aestuariirhabdus haliotis]MCL6417389.1 FCD domain-containing protein [Aestuariirhabdus haliotis]MCL6421315.1 FCD domain-containing protein [Aestuariirhabdus haliotis]